MTGITTNIHGSKKSMSIKTIFSNKLGRKRKELKTIFKSIIGLFGYTRVLNSGSDTKVKSFAIKLNFDSRDWARLRNKDHKEN